jgi:CheY-like chemotaxis protein
MSDEIVEAAIEPFFTTKPPGKGSGLGLSQVYGMVQQLNGALRIETRLGEGTTVHIFLPPAVDGSSTAPQERGRGTVATSDRTVARILVIDDDESVGQVTEAMLQDLGHSVMLAPNGQVGLDILAADASFELLLVDMVMPGMSGIDAVRQARAAQPGLKVLYMSGYADIDLQKRTGADSVIRKPFALHELDAAIRAALAEPGSA